MVPSQHIRSRDGFLLSAAHFVPREPSGKAVLIAAELGVPMTFYWPFAQWLSEQGIAVFTFDYRGVGYSRPKSLRGFDTSLLQWGHLDLDAALRWPRKAQPDAELTVIAHGMSAQLLGFTPENQGIERIIALASPHPYWANWPLSSRIYHFLQSYLYHPFLIRTLGYFPGNLFSPQRSLPKGVARDRNRWRRMPEGLVGNYAGRYFEYFSGTLLSVSFSDDRLAPLKAVNKFRQFFPQADTQQTHISPRENGLTRIGHWGFFNQQQGKVLWPRLLNDFFLESGMLKNNSFSD